MSFADFTNEIARINDVLRAINLASWDARTMMPPGGVDARGHLIATLTGIGREMVTSDRLARLLDSAEREVAGAEAGDLRRRAIAQARAEIAVLQRLPARLVGELAGIRTKATTIWAEARRTDDFPLFAPVLERIFDLQREVSDILRDGDHPYDPMLQMYEPGMTHVRLQSLFDDLKRGLAPLIDRARDVAPPAVDIMARSFPVEQQRAFGLELARKLGFDITRGRLDETLHPFEISSTSDDVRITCRYRPDWLPGGLFAMWHEAGHAIYEQNVAPEFSRGIFATDLTNLYAVGGTSFGVHESQSRLWENRVCRAPGFWDLHFPALQRTFPDQLGDVAPRDFWRAVNTVTPGHIRVEADELTYDMHIILRSEIETAILVGDLKLVDMPEAWNTKMRDYLGVEVTRDSLGVLQDAHWAGGRFGSFPTYTLGNVMSSQFFAAASRDTGVPEGLARGDYAPLQSWLKDNVHRHGRSKAPTELLRDATGAGLQIAPYIRDLTEKVEMLESV